MERHQHETEERLICKFSQTVCESQHKVLNWVIGVMFLLIGIIFSSITYTTTKGWANSDKMIEIQGQIETIKVSNEKETSYIIKTLDELKVEVKDLKNIIIKGVK